MRENGEDLEEITESERGGENGEGSDDDEEFEIV